MPATITQRIDLRTHGAVTDLAQRLELTHQAVLQRAVELLRRQVIFSEVSAAYAALHSNPQSHEEELAEREAWDATLADGLGDE